LARAEETGESPERNLKMSINTDSFNTIRRDLTMLQAYAVDKGWEISQYTNVLEISGTGDLRLTMSFTDSEYDTKSHTVYTMGEFHLLKAWVYAMPTMKEHMRGKFRQKLADMVTEAEDLEIGLEYVAMLKATAEKLASNALSAPRTSAQDEPHHADLDDEIPS
jgi:hypothetical protein